MAQFRQAMTAVHTWGGLVLGWVLSVVFATGTLSVFAGPISMWMEDIRKPETPFVAAPLETMSRVAIRELAARAPGADSWSIAFPRDGRPLQIGWRHDGEEENALLDPRSGAEAAATPTLETNGGYNFVAMHVDLHAGLAGFYLVGLATIVMLVALISGIVIHKRIFKDFFTLRLRKGQRSWLDGHNVASVLTLPFQIMIAFTGLAIFHFAYMPAGVAYHFGLPGGVEASFNQDSAYFHQLTPHEPEDAVARAEPAGLTPLAPLLVRAEAAWGRSPTFVSIQAPGDAHARILVYGAPDAVVARRALPYARDRVMTFDGVTGALIGPPPEPGKSGAIVTAEVLSALHQIGFGEFSVRYLYFACGLAGWAMMASGLVLFSVKRGRRGENEFGRATPQVYRSVEALNVICVAGIALACASAFWINRLTPADAPNRATLEPGLMLLVWATTAIHAFLRPPRAAWREQWGLAAALCLGIPIIGWLTRGDHVVAQASRGDWSHVGVEVGAVLFGAVFGWIAWKMGRPPKGDAA